MHDSVRVCFPRSLEYRQYAAVKQHTLLNCKLKLSWIVVNRAFEKVDCTAISRWWRLSGSCVGTPWDILLRAWLLVLIMSTAILDGPRAGHSCDSWPRGGSLRNRMRWPLMPTSVPSLDYLQLRFGSQLGILAIVDSRLSSGLFYRLA